MKSDPTKTLGYLLEELGELTAVVTQCLVHGVDEPNRVRLQEEIADVLAGIYITGHWAEINWMAMEARHKSKILQMQKQKIS